MQPETGIVFIRLYNTKDILEIAEPTLREFLHLRFLGSKVIVRNIKKGSWSIANYISFLIEAYLQD